MSDLHKLIDKAIFQLSNLKLLNNEDCFVSEEDLQSIISLSSDYNFMINNIKECIKECNIDEINNTDILNNLEKKMKYYNR